MSDTRIVIECPLCRSHMRVPRRGRRVRLTCHNGHALVHTFASTPTGWISRGRIVTIVGVLLALVALTRVHPRAGGRRAASPGAGATERGPGR